MTMTKSIQCLLAVAAVAGLAACTSAQDKSYKAQEKSYKAEGKMKEERLKLLDQYKKCTAKNPGQEEEVCGHLLRAIESTK